MKLRPYVIFTLVRKDVARLLRNGPALMLCGLFVIVAILVASSGLVEDRPQTIAQTAQANPSVEPREKEKAWIVYRPADDGGWIQLLKTRAPKSLGIRFVEADQFDSTTYPPNICVIEIYRPASFTDGQQVRRRINYRYPGSDPNVLWPATRWFLSASLEHFGQMPPFFETIEPIAQPTQEARTVQTTRDILENVSVADVLNVSLIGTSLLTAIQFFAACGLLVSLTAQERERGALRALLLTPVNYFEFVASKAVVHAGLALGTSTIVVAAMEPSALTSFLFWATMVFQTCGYFALGLLIASFAKNQTAPNLLSFAYLMGLGVLNLLSLRFDLFQILASLTFERYGLVFTIISLNAGGLSFADSLRVMQTPTFGMLVLLSISLLLIATFVGSRRLRA
ncbi:MAG: ABC transporter permease [Planctomycetaceae bacterium]|nr:ABC transporter permease [Planctomycetaceae bacterium]